jgi:NAD(P)-dependent dehydrogenase (short-subunit alcohol dehydrogenase family)
VKSRRLSKARPHTARNGASERLGSVSARTACYRSHPKLFLKFADVRLAGGECANTVRLELALLSKLYTVALRDLGAYSKSKHAIEAFTDSRALRIAPLGVQVSIIEPGNYNSEIGNSAAKRTGVDSRLTDRTKYKEPDDVAQALAQAFFEPNPKRRYMVVPSEHEAEIMIKKEIDQLAQLNEGHVYTHDREALIKMFDEAPW